MKRKKRTIMESVKTMIHDQDLPMHLLDEATRTTTYVQNRLSHNDIGFKTPEEMYTCKKPEVIHLKIFGYPVYVHNLKEKRTKLDPSRKKGIFVYPVYVHNPKEKRTKLDPSMCIFVGYCDVSKAFRIYILGFHHIDISRDVTLDEETTLKKYRRCHLEEVHEEDVPPRMVEVEPSPEIVLSEDHDMIEPQEPPIMDISQNTKHAWVREFIKEVEIYGAL